MGHHHRRKRDQEQANLPQDTNTALNSFGNLDFSSMLSGMNLDNIDLSKIDMNKVQSMMQKIKLPEPTKNGGAQGTGGISSSADPRIELLNSIKAMMPTKRARTIDNVTKFIQISQLIMPRRSTSKK